MMAREAIGLLIMMLMLFAFSSIAAAVLFPVALFMLGAFGLVFLLELITGRFG